MLNRRRALMAAILQGSEDETNYLCFTAEEPSDISFTQVGDFSPLPVLKYRINNGSWTDYTIGTSISLSANDKCYWKGDNASFSKGSSKYINFTATGDVDASGSIMTLLDSTDTSRTLYNYCFNSLFEGCTNLKTAPQLPSTSILYQSYKRMFYGCSQLTSAPELSINDIGIGGCNEMFYNCSSLNYIKFTYDGSFSTSTSYNWVYGVSETGDFYYNGASTGRGTSSIPEGWTIHTF